MNEIVKLVPPPAADPATEVRAVTVAVLEHMLELARAGELTNLVAITWHGANPPQAHLSTEDKILALGAVRTMEHHLVRAWLDS